MNKEAYWQAHVKKNPVFSQEEKILAITVKALKGLMMEAFNKGCEHAKNLDGKNIGENNFKDIFKELFNKKT